MIRLDVGDKVVFNIWEVKQTNSGSLLYRIENMEDGTDRYVSEAAMENIIKLGGDVWRPVNNIPFKGANDKLLVYQYDSRKEVKE